MNNLQVIEGLCKVCTLQAEIIMGLVSSCSEEAAMAQFDGMLEAAERYRELTGEELCPIASKDSDSAS